MVMTYPVTERQIDYLRSLMSKREWQSHMPERDLVEIRIAEGTLDGRTVSSLIDALKAAPMAATKNVGALSVGMYRTSDGTMYRIHESRESGRLYAKRMVWDMLTESKPRFEYDRGAIYRLTSDDRLSVEDARAWGVETGVCCVCGAFLTDSRSVARGIGPVCEGKV
jgi:hypothetical protein